MNKNEGWAAFGIRIWYFREAKQIGYVRISVHTPLASGEIETYLNYLRTFLSKALKTFLS